MKNILFLQKVYKSTTSNSNKITIPKTYNLNDLVEKLTKEELKDLTFDGETKDWYQYKNGIWERLSEYTVKKLLWKTLAKDPILVNKLNPDYLKKVMESFAILNSKSFHKNYPRQHSCSV